MRLLHLRKYIQLFMLVYILGVIAISFFFKGLTNLFVVLELIPPFGVTWMLWVTYRYQQGNERIFWLLMGLGTGSYGVAQLIWSCYKWIYRESIPNPSIADFFWNMQNVMFLIALFFILMQQKNAFKGFRLIFDCVIIMVAVGALGWEFVIYPNLQSMLEHTKWLIIITNLGYTIADLGIVFCMLIVYLGNKTLFHKKVLLMLTLGLVVFLFADYEKCRYGDV